MVTTTKRKIPIILNGGAEVIMASASTVNIGGALSNNIKITGTTTITAFDNVAAGTFRKVRFTNALTLTHNATSLILPSAANITTANGDTLEVFSLGSGNWKVFNYTKADGTALVSSGSASSVNDNLIINSQGMIAQRGTTFTSSTTPSNNDDTYLLDRMLLVSDGNDIVDVSQELTTVPTGSYSAIKFDQETASKQWGYVQIIEARDAAAIIGGTASLSFKARKGGSNTTLETLRAAIISWSSTADSVTSDVVGTWAGAGTDPTLATNWTYENTPSDLTLTTSYQTFEIENVSIDTASTKNVAVFIWCDDTDATVGDLAYITDIKLEKGSAATDYVTTPYSKDLLLSQRFLPAFNSNSSVSWIGNGFVNGSTLVYALPAFHTPARIAPSGIIISSSSHFSFIAAGSIFASTSTIFVESSLTSARISLAVTGATAGRGGGVYFNNASGKLLFTGCEL